MTGIVPLDEMIQDALGPLRPVLAGRRVVVSIAAEAHDVSTDRPATEIAIRDLVVTAHESMPPNQELALAAARWGDCVEMRIPGIEASILRGTCPGGPGLARAKAAVTPSGGDAWVEPSPGGGATLALRLKAANE